MMSSVTDTPALRRYAICNKGQPDQLTAQRQYVFGLRRDVINVYQAVPSVYVRIPECVRVLDSAYAYQSVYVYQSDIRTHSDIIRVYTYLRAECTYMYTSTSDFQ